jgi:hypothetical protein
MFCRGSCQYSDQISGWTTGVRLPTGARRDFFFSPQRLTGSGDHPTSYPMGTGGEAAEAWNWPLTSIQCRGQEYVELHFHSSLRFHGRIINNREQYASVTVGTTDFSPDTTLPVCTLQTPAWCVHRTGQLQTCSLYLQDTGRYGVRVHLHNKYNGTSLNVELELKRTVPIPWFLTAEMKSYLDTGILACRNPWNEKQFKSGRHIRENSVLLYALHTKWLHGAESFLGSQQSLS